MPGLGGLAAARRITTARSAAAVVLVSTDPQDVPAAAAEGCGALAMSKHHCSIVPHRALAALYGAAWTGSATVPDLGDVIDVVVDGQGETGRRADHARAADRRRDGHQYADDLGIGGAGRARALDREPAR